jgi:hypothetical protein
MEVVTPKKFEGEWQESPEARLLDTVTDLSIKSTYSEDVTT